MQMCQCADAMQIDWNIFIIELVKHILNNLHICIYAHLHIKKITIIQNQQI